MGPTFVHTHRDENSYLRFFSALNRMNPNFRYQMQAVGSDGDEATMNAIAVSFTPESFVNLLCASDKKENIEYKLKEMNPVTPATKYIVSDIFGTNVYSLYCTKKALLTDIFYYFHGPLNIENNNADGTSVYLGHILVKVRIEYGLYIN